MKMLEEIMFNNFMFYFLYSSSVIIYGAGLNYSIQNSNKPSKLFSSFVRILFTVIITSVLVFLIEHYLLAKLNIMDLFPFAAVVVFLLVSLLLETIFRKSVQNRLNEYAFSLVCILLTLSESLTLIETIVIGSSTVLSIVLLVPVLYAIRKRIEISNPLEDFKNSSLLLITLSILSLLTLVWNVSWLNKGVLH